MPADATASVSVFDVGPIPAGTTHSSSVCVLHHFPFPQLNLNTAENVPKHLTHLISADQPPTKTCNQCFHDACCRSRPASMLLHYLCADPNSGSASHYITLTLRLFIHGRVSHCGFYPFAGNQNANILGLRGEPAS